MPDGASLGPTCPTCGHPLRSPAAPCPHCGEAASLPEQLRWGVLTPFGYGFCGAIIGGEGAVALNLTVMASHPRYHGLLLVAAVAVVATVCAQVGKRLLPELRQGYEQLLVALLVGGVCSDLLALLPAGGASLVAPLWLLAAALIYRWLRRRSLNRFNP